MEVTFYRARNGKVIPDLLIGLATLSRFSHVELRLDELAHFSSSYESGGVRTTDITVHESHWCRYGIIAPLGVMDDLRTQAALMSDEAAPYDLLSLLTWRFDFNDLSKWFCSEVCAYLMRKNGLLPDWVPARSRKISPGTLEAHCSHHPLTFRYLPPTAPFWSDARGDHEHRRTWGMVQVQRKT